MIHFLVLTIFLFSFQAHCIAEEFKISEDFTIVKDKAGRSYKHRSINGQGRFDQIMNLDKLKKGIITEEFTGILGSPNKMETAGELEVFFYIVAVADRYAQSQEERDNSKEYLPDYDLEWEPFFFKKKVFIGCGSKMQDEVNKEYGTKFFSSYVRFGTQRPEELGQLCQ